MKQSYALFALFLCAISDCARADTFGSGIDTFNIDFVTIGNPGNASDITGDPNPAGSVSYTYRMGKFEISEQMIDKANVAGGLGITKDTRGPNKPATSITWYEAAAFINWLNNSTGNAPAYKFDANGTFQLWAANDGGYDPANLYRNSSARYFLPSDNEWYKSAYFDPTTGVYYDYPTGSNNIPTAVGSGTAVGTAVIGQSLANGPADINVAGGLSPFGTMAQGGNGGEWEETEFDLVNDLSSPDRGARGGKWDDNKFNPFLLRSDHREGAVPFVTDLATGFRVASIAIPEPSALGLISAAAFITLATRRRKSVHHDAPVTAKSRGPVRIITPFYAGCCLMNVM